MEPFIKACQAIDRDDLKKLGKIVDAKDFDVDSRDDNGKTLLMVAAIAGKTEAARLLVERGANVQKLDKNGFDPLFFSMKFDQGAMADFLLSKGANGNRQYPNGNFVATALWLAVASNKPECVKALLKNGADVNVKNSGDKNTPLHAAAEYGLAELAETLAESGAELEAKNREGFTPLWLAKKNGRTGVAAALARRGAVDEEV